MKCTVDVFGKQFKISLDVGRYSNDRVAISAIDEEDGDMFGRLTVNLPEEELGPDEIFVKTWSENKVWVQQVLAAMPHVFQDTGRKAQAGYTEAAIWKFTLLGDIGGEEI